jgi:hypothetical protein
VVRGVVEGIQGNEIQARYLGDHFVLAAEQVRKMVDGVIEPGELPAEAIEELAGQAIIGTIELHLEGSQVVLASFITSEALAERPRSLGPVGDDKKLS